MEPTSIPPAVLLHAAAAFLVLLLGPVNLFRPARDRLHRWLGRTWVLLMYVTCGSSFFFGLDDGFTALHGLSVITAVSVTVAVWGITRGQVQTHRATMGFSYLGTLIAFGFAALVPQRLIWTTAVTDPLALLLFSFALLTIAGAWVLILHTRLTRTPVPAG